jgi:hypothetical protein
LDWLEKERNPGHLSSFRAESRNNLLHRGTLARRLKSDKKTSVVLCVSAATGSDKGSDSIDSGIREKNVDDFLLFSGHVRRKKRPAASVANIKPVSCWGRSLNVTP